MSSTAGEMSSTGPPPDAAPMPSAREEESNARITYSTDFLLSLAGSQPCNKLPAGVDASLLSDLNQATPLGSSNAAGANSYAPRWESSDCQGDLWNPLDRHPGNQNRQNWQNIEHDGLLGSGADAFPRSPCYVGPLASNDQGSGYQLNRNSSRYQPPRLYKAVPVSRKDNNSINDETFGSNKDKVEEERKRRASFEFMRKEQHKALQEKTNAPDSDKENLGDAIISLLKNSTEKRGPPLKSDKEEKFKASSLFKENAIKTSSLLPTPKTRPLKPPGFANALPEKRLQLQSSNTSLNSENEQLNTEDIMVSSLPESSKCAQWLSDEGSGHAEGLSSSKNLLSVIVQDENLFAENMVGRPSASGDTFENISPRSPGNCDVGSKLLHCISPTPAVGILKEYSTDDITEAVPVMTCEDLEHTILSHVNDASNSNLQNTVQEHRTVLDEPSTAKKIALDQHASRHILSLLQKGTNSKDSSPLEFHMGQADELFSSNSMVNGRTTASAPVNNAETIPTSGKNMTTRPSSFPDDYHLGEHMVPFGQSKGVSGVEYGNPKFPGSIWRGARCDEKGLEIQLPEEDDLFSVNDSMHAQNTNDLPYAESARAKGLLPEKEVTDLNYRFQSLVSGEAKHVQLLGHDVSWSHSHERRDQVDPNNLYHLFQSRPSAQSPRNRTSTMFPPMDNIANKNRQAPFNMPESIHRGTRSFPQDMNSIQQVLPAPGGPRFDQAAHHLMLQHMSMPGSFPPQGLPRGVRLSQPVHHMPDYRTEMSNVNSFQMHPCQPSYGDFGMMMTGPPGLEVGVNHAGALEGLVQMELRARSKQIHPAMAGPVQGFYGSELNMNFRY